MMMECGCLVYDKIPSSDGCCHSILTVVRRKRWKESKAYDLRKCVRKMNT